METQESFSVNLWPWAFILSSSNDQTFKIKLSGKDRCKKGSPWNNFKSTNNRLHFIPDIWCHFYRHHYNCIGNHNLCRKPIWYLRLSWLVGKFENSHLNGQSCYTGGINNVNFFHNWTNQERIFATLKKTSCPHLGKNCLNCAWIARDIILVGTNVTDTNHSWNRTFIFLLFLSCADARGRQHEPLFLVARLWWISSGGLC